MSKLLLNVPLPEPVIQRSKQDRGTVIGLPGPSVLGGRGSTSLINHAQADACEAHLFRHRPNATVSQWPLEWLRRLAPHAVALTPKGPLIRCTVLGSRPKRAAILRTLSPVAFLAFKASRIRFSSSAGIRGR